ncbi:2OG-Fe(II) oxygenase [Rhodoferax saidenbachensis]|uniref:Prolyl 4-hydroxylase n=1 Tax=Rhodoferax saidenbachensis TaxID=1484693 RepID=A0ABU1ZVC4_9BURK|nr:2OG-Fe(II) oxygenase [Rhodoferax saidenbachensis]MDR7308815.1 prolyl 4-hydroxylase [Rhodoferax saidenbachensis]
MVSATKTPKVINENWRRWLRDNLARNVPSSTLIGVMVEREFDADAVNACIEDIRSRPPEPSNAIFPEPDHLAGDWQAWVVRNIQKGVLEQTLIDAASREIKAAWAQRIKGLHLKSESQGYNYATAPTPRTGTISLEGRSIPILLEMAEPRITVYGNVLTKEECESLIALSQPKMLPSQTHDPATAKLVVKDFRSSQGTYFDRGDNDLIKHIERRLADLAQWPVENGEGMQVLQYRQGGEYRPHFDFFPPESPTSRLPMKNGGQRVATLIVYLNTVEDGGETYFPQLKLKIKPIQGNVLYFSYTDAESGLDRQTLHGGAPPVNGEKWIMTKWLRQKEFKYNLA